MIPRTLDLPPLWLALFAAVVWGLGHAAPLDLTLDRLFAVPLLAIGVLLMLAAAVQMALRHTPLMPHREPSALVTQGVFALSRNPIYLGDAFVLAGLCLWWNATYALVLVPAFMWLITVRFIVPEESRCDARFGADFAEYRAAVRRWI